MPSTRAMVQASLGLRASNNSATRGRPPVMSFVLATLRGVLATIVPAEMVFSVLHGEVGACGNGMMSQNFAGLGIADDHLRVKFLLVFHHDKGGGTGSRSFLGNGDAGRSYP